MAALPEPAGQPPSEAVVAAAGLPAPIRLLAPPAAKRAPAIMHTDSKAPPMKGPPPGKATAVQAEPEKNVFFADAVAVQSIPASPDVDDPHGSLLFFWQGGAQGGLHRPRKKP